MGYTIYILQSESGKFYVGHTRDLRERLERHNKGYSKFTKNGAGSWKVVYSETFETRGVAMKRELKIKAQKSKAFIRALIHSGVVE